MKKTKKRKIKRSISSGSHNTNIEINVSPGASPTPAMMMNEADMALWRMTKKASRG